MRTCNRCLCFTLVVTLIIVVVLSYLLNSIKDSTVPSNILIRQTECNNYSRPIIFIGGMPRSGTTLMRAILDSHPLVRCGEETRVVPRILSMRSAWKKQTVEWNRLIAGGISENILDSAVRAFVYEILVRHGGPDADILCDKDPFVLKHAVYVTTIFPNSKFLLLIRDGRAVIHSVMTRKVTITGFSLTDYKQNLKSWNQGIDVMVKECTKIGDSNCLFVYYEQLVLHPRVTIEKILKFLNIPWVDSVLHHDELIDKKISLSKTEHSSDQVIKPINLEALTRWVGHVPDNVKNEIDTLAPMLKQLGYDTKSDNPSYGTADSLVIENTNNIKRNISYWNERMKQYDRKMSNTTSIASVKTLTVL
ncbi:unnamed protein product [Didymodactylos carnosus]|uniref:Protein-tyrosine sulfotransferase n=1 Tax=Didymodactylos carnosus TaxID=1234261 RepID=A0A813TUW4_9BILA|nr:unnamed protein product [Didymodactylos carnosus]CAF0906942.1 unnamed protein product [Didymodactylos carnosus]CAF3603902.1 unnamed protein product [Didymodactylos carnosus]CAF3686659.1 unnamed protein product [Didymodactylos carnosus]